MLRLDEKVVYPGHGVAQISQILERSVGGQKAVFYELQFLNKEMTILVPADNCHTIGVRTLITKIEVEEVLALLQEPPRKIHPYELNASSWNKRNKSYQAELRTGNVKKIACIYRDLHHISVLKDLSFGERNLLAQTEQLIAQEISLVLAARCDDIVFQMRSSFTSPMSAGKIPAVTL